MSGRSGERGIKLLVLFVLMAMAISIVYPLLWMVYTGFKTNAELFLNTWSLPKKWQWNNYRNAWDAGIGRYLFNSVYVTAVATILSVAIGALAAFPLSRFQFAMKKVVFVFIVSGLMLAPQVSVISLYKLLQRLGIYNTYWAMIVPYIAFRIPFTVFLLWSYFATLPRDVEEAAFIDGCNSWGIFRRMLIPMSKPIIATSTLLASRVIWNEFMFALVFVESSKLKTIPVGLMSLKGQNETDWTVLMAGLTMSAIPIVVLFLIMQKQFVRGLTAGGSKG